MTKYSQIGLLFATVLLSACGGGGDTNTAAAPPVAVTPAPGPSQPPAPAPSPTGPSATLAPGVVVYSAQQNALFVRRSGQDYVYAGNPEGLRIGAVVIADAGAFKVSSWRQEGGNTIITTEEPMLGELFDKLEIIGTYKVASANSDRARILSGSDRARVSAVGLGDYSYVYEKEVGDVMSATVSGVASASVDYKFSRSAGLQRAQMAFDLDASIRADFDIAKDMTLVTKERQVGTIRIPIPVSFVDAALEKIGVRIVSVVIPVIVGGDLKAETGAKFALTGTFKGSVSGDYSDSAGASLNSTATANALPIEMVGRAPGGVAVLASFGLRPGLFLKFRPALAVLETVALIGYETRFSFETPLTVQVIEPYPSFCVQAQSAVNFSGSAFFKTPNISKALSESQLKNLWNGPEVVSDACRANVGITPLVKPTLVDTWEWGRPARLEASVFKTVGTVYNPSSIPSGTLTFTLDGQTCVATLLDSTTGGRGGCALTPTRAGSRTVEVKYSGDKAYAPKNSTQTIVIDKAGTTVSVKASPTSDATPLAVKVEATVAPTGGRQGLPTGSVSFFDSTGKQICSATVVSGSAICVGSLTQSTTIRADYAGDEDFLRSSSAAINYQLSVDCTPERRAALAAAVVGQWGVSRPGTYNEDSMTIEPNGVGYYTVPDGRKFGITWKIVSYNEPVPSYFSTSSSPLRPLGTSPGCIFLEYGYWHPAYSGYVRTNLNQPLTAFTVHDLGGVAGWPVPNYFGTDLSKVPVVMTYRKK
jgi:hypothetical protein